jgi:hypothetical protein
VGVAQSGIFKDKFIGTMLRYTLVAVSLWNVERLDHCKVGCIEQCAELLIAMPGNKIEFE